MKVLLLSLSYPPEVSGIATAVREMALGLKDAGHEPRVLCVRRGKKPSDIEEDQEGVIIRRVTYKQPILGFTHPLRDAKELWHILPSVLSEFQPDVIWSRWIKFSVALSRRDAGVPFIHIPPSAYKISFTGQLQGVALSFRNLPRVIKWRILMYIGVGWEREVLMKCHHAVVFSENVKRQFAKLYPEWIEKVTVVAPGIDADTFPVINRNEAYQWLSNTWSIPNNRKILLYVGRLEPDKHVHHLIEMMFELKGIDLDSFNKAHLVIVGDGSLRNRLERLAVRQGIDERITFAGYQREDLGRFYSGAWVHILPTYVESFGQVLVEASLCKTPSIAFRPNNTSVFTAADSLIVDGETGLLVDTPSTYELASTVSLSMEWSDHIRDKMGAAARDWILANFRRDHFVRDVICLSSET